MGFQEILGRRWGWGRRGWGPGGRVWDQGLCQQEKVSGGGGGVHTRLRVCVVCVSRLCGVCLCRVCVCVCVPAASGRRRPCSGRNHTINNSRCGVLLRARKDCDSVTWPGRPTGSFLPRDDMIGWGQAELLPQISGPGTQTPTPCEAPRTLCREVRGPAHTRCGMNGGRSPPWLPGSSSCLSLWLGLEERCPASFLHGAPWTD